jgi:hypothetical protein
MISKEVQKMATAGAANPALRRRDSCHKEDVDAAVNLSLLITDGCQFADLAAD